MKMICGVLVQSPETVHTLIKEWLEREENQELSTSKSREFVVKVKSALLEKGYKMDYGYHEIGCIARVEEDAGHKERDQRKKKGQRIVEMWRQE